MISWTWTGLLNSRLIFYLVLVLHLGYIKKEPVKNNKPLHMILTNVCPLTGLRCERTYFLNPYPGSSEKVVEAVDEERYITGYTLNKTNETSLSNQNRLSTYYLKILQLYFKLTEKLEGNLQYTSILNFKAMLLKKLQEVDAKSNTTNMDMEIEVNFRCYDAIGKEININKLAEASDEPQRAKYGMTSLVWDNYLLVVQLKVKNIPASNSLTIVGDMIVSDSFLLSHNTVINLTKKIRYFDFFNLQSTSDSSLQHLKDPYLYQIMGAKVQTSVVNADIYIPLTDKIQHFGVDTSYIDGQLLWYENGLVLDSSKLGTLFVLFNDIVSFKYISEPNTNLIEVKLNESLILKKFAKPLVVLRFKGKAVSDCFYELVKSFENMEKPVEKLSKDSPISTIKNKDDKDEIFVKAARVYSQMKMEYENQLGVYLDDEHRDVLNRETTEGANYTNSFEIILLVGYLNNKKALVNHLIHHTSANSNIELIPIQTDYSDSKNTDSNAYMKNLVGKLASIEASTRRTIACINIPYFINYKEVISGLNSRNYAVNKVVSYINGQLLLKHFFSGHVIEPYLNSAYIDVAIVNVKGLNSADFDYIYKLQNAPTRVKILQTKDERLDNAMMNTLLSKSKHKLITVKPEIDNRGKCYYVDWRIPFDRVYFLNTLQTIFDEHEGIMLKDSVQRKITMQPLNGVESELLLLQQRVHYIKQYYLGGGVLVHSIRGIIKFINEPSSVYHLKVSKGLVELVEIISQLPSTEIEYKDQLLVKTEYPDKTLQSKFGMFIDFSGQLNVETLKTYFANNFIRVS